MPSTVAAAKSPMVTPMSSAPGFARSRATIASDSSIPWTGTPRAASGSATRPVPMPSSSAAPLTRELGDQVDDRADDGRIRLIRVPLVETGGDLLAEVVVRHRSARARYRR